MDTSVWMEMRKGEDEEGVLDMAFVWLWF